MRLPIATVVLLALVGSAAAQSFGVMVAGGLGKSPISTTSTTQGWDHFNTGNFVGGASVKFRRIVGFAAVDNSFYRTTIPPSTDFVVDPTIPSNCRNRINGQFATSASCLPTNVSQGSRAWLSDANVLLSPLPIMAGAGYRFGDSRKTSGVYVSGGYAKGLRGINGLFFTRALVGKSVSQFQVGVSIYR